MKIKRAPYRKWLCQFDLKDPVLMLKVRHINNVVGFSKILSDKMEFFKYDNDLAVFIAQHHDDGRFIQWRDYQTFRDVMVCHDGKMHPHAQLGVELLFDANYIEVFTSEIFEEERSVIFKAIAAHGDLILSEHGMTDREILHCKIIRDADMLDNLVNVMAKEKMETLLDSRGSTCNELWASEISDSVFDVFMSCKSIDYKIIDTPAEWWLAMVAYIFNLSLQDSLKILYNANSIEKIFNRLSVGFSSNQTNDRMKQAYLLASSYVRSAV